jgi:antirestriction protein
MQPIRIWLGDLGAYNNGELRGEWLELPLSEAALAAAFNKYSRDGDYYIADSEGPDWLRIEESTNIFALNEFATALADMSKHDVARVGFLVSWGGQSYSDALDNYEDVTFYEGMRLVDVAVQLVQEGVFGDVPSSRIAHYIDYEAIARDLGHDGYHEETDGLFYSNGKTNEGGNSSSNRERVIYE